MSKGAAKPLRAHQLLHGYKRGHRLLAGSTSLPSDALRLVDRLSDAAGMSVSRDPGGYLTGYPLPGGDYALARTWPAPDAERPNVVWTHTLVLPQAALSAVSMQPLDELFRLPRGHADLDSYNEPLPLEHLANLPPKPARNVNGPAIITVLYWGEPGAWLSATEAPDDLCLAIWSQQWPRLRRSFSFCSGALEPRRLDGKPFDLLLAPEGHRTGHSPRTRIPESPSVEAVHALLNDLGSPGPLRDFFRACGADSGQLRFVALLTDAWVSARNARNPTAVLANVAAQAPEPSGLRRLKRGLLRGPSPLLSHADPVLTWQALATAGVGDRILAEDADVDTWAARAWQVDRRAVLGFAQHVPAAERPAGQPRTAADAVPEAAVALVVDRAVPADLGSLAAEAPSAASAVLAQHHEPEWWDAWAGLPDGGKALAHVATSDENRAHWAAGALLKRRDGAGTWKTMQGTRGVAVLGLLSAAAETGKPLPSEWAAALGSSAEHLIREIENGLPPALLAVAADAAPYAPAVSRLPWREWKPLSADGHLWRHVPVRAAVVLGAALGSGGEDSDAAAAAAFAQLHKVFSEGRADEAWRVIQPILPGRADDWDRCRRLEQGVAKAVSGRRARARPGILAHLRGGKPREALAGELHRLAVEASKREQAKGPFDDWFGFLRR